MIGHNRSEVVLKSEAHGIPPVSLPQMSSRSLWELICFLMICIVAYTGRNFNLFEMASEPVRQILGCPPPAYLINIALAIYCFSAAVLTLTAMAGQHRPTGSWNQLGYRSAFFVFYCFSGTISAHFFPVLLVGLFLYGLDQCQIWYYANQHDTREGTFAGRP
jgi:hypothetical protein